MFELSTACDAPKHHWYEKIFSDLQENTQADILRLSGERIGPSALASNHMGVLKELGSNFSGLRYPYEKYSGMTEQQYFAVGNDWIAQGGDISDADYRYHPEELLGLTWALQQLATQLMIDPVEAPER